MRPAPEPIRLFLDARRIAVTGVARDGRLPANAIYRRLRSCGHDVVPVNPNAREVEGAPCYPDLRSIPGSIEAVMVASPPASGAEIVRQAASRGVRHLWFHRSFGEGSVDPEALAECRRLGLQPIVGGCPLMFCGTVDVFHRCVGWWLLRRGRIVA